MYNSSGYGSNNFLELAKKIFKARMILSPGEISRGAEGSEEYDYEPEGFFRDIELLIEKDQKRIGDNKLTCYKGCFANFELDTENEQGCFVRVLLRFALEHAGKRVNEVLKDFYDTYKKNSHCGDMERTYQRYTKLCGISWEDFEECWLNEGWIEFYYPFDEKIYETMLSMFFRGCAELIMLGRGADIADTVAELVLDFWKTAQSYKETEDLQKFYEDTFGCIVGGIFNIDDRTADKDKKQPKDVLKFLSNLIKLCRVQNRPVWENVKKHFAKVIDGLEKYEKKHEENYYEETIRVLKEII